jgi:hypothetical protein
MALEKFVQPSHAEPSRPVERRNDRRAPLERRVLAELLGTVRRAFGASHFDDLATQLTVLVAGGADADWLIQYDLETL